MVVITGPSLPGTVSAALSLSRSVPLDSSCLTGHCRAPPALSPVCTPRPPALLRPTVCTPPASTAHSAAKRASKHFTLHTLHLTQISNNQSQSRDQLPGLQSSGNQSLSINWALNAGNYNRFDTHQTSVVREIMQLTCIVWFYLEYLMCLARVLVSPVVISCQVEITL